MTKSKPNPPPIDPFTIDWPREAFKVGEGAVVKPHEIETLSLRGINCKGTFTLNRDDGSDCPYLMAKQGQPEPKPVKTPKPSKLQLAIDASKQRTADLEALVDLETKAKTNKAEARELSARIRELRAKVGEL